MSAGETAGVRLTKGQRAELTRMLGGPQYTYGKGRARVQNAPVAAKLATFYNDGYCGMCRITNAGRAALAPPATPTPGGKL